MLKVAGFAPQSPTLVSQNTFSPSSQGAWGARSVSPQKLSGQLLAEPLSVTAGGQSLAARNMQSLPLVNSWLLQGTTDAVEAHEAMFRSNMDIYQQVVDLDVRLQALKSVFDSLLQAGVTQFGEGVGDKMQKLFNQLGQLRNDYAAVQEQLKMQGDFETHYLQLLSERTELLCKGEGWHDGVGDGRELQVVPEVAVARAQSGLVACSPEMDGADEWLESEIVPRTQQRSASQLICVTDESYLQAFGESHIDGAVLQELPELPERDHGTGGEAQHSPDEYLQSDLLLADRTRSELLQRQGVSGDEELDEPDDLSSAPLQHEVELSDIQYTDTVAQKVSELMLDCGELYEQVNHLSAGPDSESIELEGKIANLSRRCNELQDLVADFDAQLQTRVTSLGKRDLQGPDSVGAYQQGDSGRVFGGEIDGLRQNLQDLRLQIDSAISANLEAEERLRELQGKSGLTDEEAKELCNIKVQHKLLEIESGFLSIDNKMLAISHDSQVQQMTSEIERQKREFQMQLCSADERVDELRELVKKYKKLLEREGGLLAGNETVMVDYETQLRAITAVAEKLAASFAYLDSKHDEVSRALEMGREQLSGVIRKLAETTESPEAAKEVVAGLEEVEGELTGLTQDVNDVQRELDSVRTFLRQNSGDLLTDSSAADESDAARTIVSLGRRSVEV